MCVCVMWIHAFIHVYINCCPVEENNIPTQKIYYTIYFELFIELKFGIWIIDKKFKKRVKLNLL